MERKDLKQGELVFGTFDGSSEKKKFQEYQKLQERKRKIVVCRDN